MCIRDRHYPDRVTKLAMTGTGVGPKDMPEEQKKKIIATREGQVAKGFYGFGARVDALLGPNASPELKAEVPVSYTHLTLPTIYSV